MLALSRPARAARSSAGRARRRGRHRGRNRRLSALLELDHVLFAVRDLGFAARRFEERFGLESVEGGSHPQWGTANRIVPLGDAYVELVAVVDPEVAHGSSLGRWVAEQATDQGRPLGWAVRTDAVEPVAGRLGLTVEPGSRTRPDGSELRWRSAGVEEAAAEPCLPFFIEWAEGTTLPGRTARKPSFAISTLRACGDPDRLAAWLGEHELPIEVEPGEPELAAVVLVGPRGEIELGG